MAKFMEFESINLKLKQSKIVKKLAMSTSTLQRFRREINMLSPYRKPPSSSNTNTRHTEHDLKATSRDLKLTSNDLKMTSKKQMKLVKSESKK